MRNLALLGALIAPGLLHADGRKPPVEVFLLAGQSNMEGQGVVDLVHPRYYNGGKGTLIKLLDDKRIAARLSHVRDPNRKWTVRKDVFCRFRTKKELKRGPHSIGFTGYPGKHHIGPEYQFGHVLGDAITAPVLLIKTAWGGKSLYKDFRPPSANGNTGEYYKKMIAEIREGLKNIDSDFPSLKGRGYRIAGFVWFQGWNDAFSDEGQREYARNLTVLIKDIRQEFQLPKLPVVVGELGNLGDKASARIKTIRKAQAQATARKEFRGNVLFVKTTAFARPAKESPNVGHGHHWFGNAESYFLIGDALGKAMKKLLRK